MSFLNLLFFIFFCLLFSIKTLAIFPLTEPKGHPVNHGKIYQLEVSSQVMQFFQENNPRYFIENLLDIHPSFMDLKIGHKYSFNENHHYFKPYELAVKFRGANGQWFIGRKLKEWDWTDSFWNRGLWEPFYKEDALRPRKAGLTGIFRDFQFKKIKLGLFGSFLFIPELGPYIEESNGTLYSDNPWFISPPASSIGNTVFIYDKQGFKIKDFLHLSLGGQFSYKSFYIAYLYKPMNKTMFKADFSIPINKAPAGEHSTGYKLKIPVENIVLQHHLTSIGWILESEPKNKEIYRLKLSLTYNHPKQSQESKKKSELSYAQPPKEYMFSIAGEMSTGSTKEKFDLHLAYTHQIPITADNNTDNNTNVNTVFKIFPDVNKEPFFRDDLLKINRAASTGMSYSIYFDQATSTETQVRLIYELEKKYFLFSFYSALTMARTLSIFISGDFFFSHFPFSTKQIEDDIAMYSNKSRIFAGLKYVF